MWRANLQRWHTIASGLSSVLSLRQMTEMRGLLAPRRPRKGLAARRSRASRILVEWLHAFHIYGALGISAFGSAICAVFGWDHSRWVPLWFCAALLIFNVDRIRPDPADAINVPKRRAVSRTFRVIGWLIAIASGALLIWLPVHEQDWRTLPLILIGAAVCLGYSLPIFGKRLKEKPLLKTIFAPTVVVLAVFGLPLVHGSWPSHLSVLVLAMVWAWGYLMCNMLICDLRDLRGDKRTGIISIPVQLGRRTTHRLLWILITCTGGVAALLSAFPGSSSKAAWLLWSVIGTAYVSWLALAVRVRRPERFYEWWVEGMLFVPAAIVVLTR